MIQIRLDKKCDPDGSKLRTLLEAHSEYEWMKATRSFFMHLLAFASVLLWLGASWPSLLPAQVQAFALVLWESLFCIAAVAGIGERVWHYRQGRFLAEYQATRKGDSG
jgi:hypothetical protein